MAAFGPFSSPRGLEHRPEADLCFPLSPKPRPDSDPSEWSPRPVVGEILRPSPPSHHGDRRGRSARMMASTEREQERSARKAERADSCKRCLLPPCPVPSPGLPLSSAAFIRLGQTLDVVGYPHTLEGSWLQQRTSARGYDGNFIGPTPPP